MAIKGLNFKFNSATTNISSYDQNKINIGTLIKQYSGGTVGDNFIGPSKIGLARPMEQSTPISSAYPHVVPFSDDIDWVFLAETSIAAATRRIILYEYDKRISQFNWKGFITLNFPTTGNQTIKGLRAVKTLYTTGTVGVVGTAVTGSGSSWALEEQNVGCRIGFGSTDPTQITIWYEISAISSDTLMTLSSSAEVISAGTPYVIEDLVIVTTTINATATNGGLFITKGVNFDLFSTVGSNIPAATTVDNIRAVYWIADASTVTNTISTGGSLGPFISWTNQSLYVIDATGPKVYVYNFRKPLTLTAGKDTTALTIKTGNQAVTGTISQVNNGRYGVLNHGVANGVPSLYFATTTRIYRAAISTIQNGSVTWQSDTMTEVPPGGASTYALTNALSSCEIANDIDKLIIVSTGIVGARSYVTDYNTIATPFNHIFLNDDKQLDQSIADNGGVPHPSILASTMSIWSESGTLYLARIGTTAILNQVYTIPIGAHQTYAITNNQMLISPKFDISDSVRLYDVSTKYINKLGTDTFSLPTEPFKMYFRTSGINDNSGLWTQLDEYGDLSGISGTEIQFGYIFKILGTTCIPARVLGISMTYEDSTTDSHYQPSIANSSVVNRMFAYRQQTVWSSNIPNMRIRLYNAVSGALLLDDDVFSSAFGNFEYSNTGGSSWSTWSPTADLVGNYIRYTATSLPAGTRVRALLTQS